MDSAAHGLGLGERERDVVAPRLRHVEGALLHERRHLVEAQRGGGGGSGGAVAVQPCWVHGAPQDVLEAVLLLVDVDVDRTQKLAQFFAPKHTSTIRVKHVKRKLHALQLLLCQVLRGRRMLG